MSEATFDADYNPTTPEIHGAIRWKNIVLDKNLLSLPKAELYRNLRDSISDKELVGEDLAEAFSRADEQNFRFRSFWRRTDTKDGKELPTDPTFPSSTYSEAVRLIQEKGVEKDLEHDQDDGLWTASTPMVNYLVPRVSGENARSFILVYGRDSERKAKIAALVQENSEHHLSVEDYNRKLREINSDFLTLNPRDALTRGGVLEIAWE